MNPMKNKALVISRSRTLAPIFPNLVLDSTVIGRVTALKVLGSRFGYKNCRSRIIPGR